MTFWVGWWLVVVVVGVVVIGGDLCMYVEYLVCKR